VCVAVAGACDDGGPPARGFGSRQLLQLRDPSFTFLFPYSQYALFNTGDPDLGETVQAFAVDVDTGEIRSYMELSELPVPLSPGTAPAGTSSGSAIALGTTELRTCPT